MARLFAFRLEGQGLLCFLFLPLGRFTLCGLATLHLKIYGYVQTYGQLELDFDKKF